MTTGTAHDVSFLANVLPTAKFSFAPADLELHASDASPHEESLPDAVCWPTTTDEVAAILSAANEQKVPITPWSGGTSLEGNPIPVEGGIVLDTYEMEGVSVRPDDLQATVGPGIVYDDLNEKLAQYGLRFPPGISSGDVATVGGMIANNASGFNAVRYGETRDHVLRVEVVLPDGRIIECGRDVIKTSSGYSLKDLVIGSEGTLGVVTEATLGLAPIPDQKRAALVTFPTRADASRAVSDLIRFGLRPGAVEFVDTLSIEMIDAYADDLDLRAEPSLILELHANNDGIDEDLTFARGICEDNDATGWNAVGEDRMDEIWRARRDALPAYRAYREDWDVAVVGDVVVPISKYPDIVTAVGEFSDDLDLVTPCVGHAGDGNLHYTPLVDTDDGSAVERAHELNERVVTAAIEMGGTATGEHGVGLGKRKFMNAEHAKAVDVMAAIKDAIDPNGIMNPGKVLPNESDESVQD